jgi:biotin carboxyl carrier protein
VRSSASGSHQSTVVGEGGAAAGREQGADDGVPADTFWSQVLEAFGLALRARRVLLVEQTDTGAWQALGQWPEDAAGQAGDYELLARAADQARPVAGTYLAKEAAAAGGAVAVRVDPEGSATQPPTALVALDTPLPATVALMLARLLAALPAQRVGGAVSSARQALAPPQDKARRLYEVLQLAMRLGAETRFLRAAFSLCNELAVRFACEQVALGWSQSGYVRLTAVSHVEKFDPRSSASTELESAMEEAASHGAEVFWPQPPDAAVRLHAHQTYARQQGVGSMMSMPLQLDGEIVAVLSLQRREAGFDEQTAWELRLIGEACARRLQDLRHTDRWFGARWWFAAGRWANQLLGPSNTGWKLAGFGAVTVLVGSALLPWSYRIDASLALRSEDVLFVPAPFDGYLRKVNVRVGDQVESARVLLELDTRELILEESMAVADELKYRNEAERGQGARQLAEMQIARARQQQAASKLDLIRHQLASAQVRAPFPSVVVEGDLKKNLGAPVRKGDLLVKLARTGDTYLEIEVDQADVHEVRLGSRGEFALVGRPDLKYSFVVDRIDPQSTQREARNVYLVRGRIEVGYQNWWRPGMGGSARIDVGERSLLWVMTHRTIRFLRQVFWI